MDFHILMAERRRVADEFRARLTCLGILRKRLADASTDETRQHFYAAVDAEMATCRGLGDKLLQIDASIVAMQTHGRARSPTSAASYEAQYCQVRTR